MINIKRIFMVDNPWDEHYYPVTVTIKAECENAAKEMLLTLECKYGKGKEKLRKN